MALANVGGSNEHPRELRRGPLVLGHWTLDIGQLDSSGLWLLVACGLWLFRGFSSPRPARRTAPKPRTPAKGQSANCTLHKVPTVAHSASAHRASAAHQKSKAKSARSCSQQQQPASILHPPRPPPPAPRWPCCQPTASGLSYWTWAYCLLKLIAPRSFGHIALTANSTQHRVLLFWPF
jgi:hypothetical protein